MEQSKQVETKESSTPSTSQVPYKKRKYRCKKCYQFFLKLDDLKEHNTTENHHYQCTLCENKVFFSDALLKRHLSVSHGVTFKCDYCKKVFKTVNTLKVHSLIHLGKKPFVCEICKTAFHRKHHLKKHLLLHSSVKGYKCDKCQLEFSQLDKLKEHIMTHSGARPYQCVHCLRSFTIAAHLKNHVKSQETKAKNKLTAVAAAAIAFINRRNKISGGSGHSDESICQQSLFLQNFLQVQQQQQVETESSGKEDGIDQQQQLTKFQTFFDNGSSAIFIAKN